MSKSGHAGDHRSPAAPAQPHPERRARKSHRGIWITLGSIFGVLAVACGLLAYFVVLPIIQQDAEISAAAVAASAFCADLKSQDYAAAYDMLSTRYQSTVTKQQFLQESALRDQIDGPVKTCPIPNSGPNVSVGDNKVTLFISLTRANVTQGSITVVKQGGNWKLEKVADALLGTDVAPLLVAETYCNALVNGDYATAYAQLSSAKQEQITEQDFAAQFQADLSQLGPDAKIATCAPTVSTYKVAPSASPGTPTTTPATGVPASGATVNVALNFSVGGSPFGQPITLALTLIQENDAWKIDNQQTIPTA